MLGLANNAYLYRDSLAQYCRNAFQGIPVNTYGNEVLDYISPELPKDINKQINIFSLLLNTNNWGTENIDLDKIDIRDIQEEVQERIRRGNSKRLDPNIFSDLENNDYERMAKIKASEYRKQGQIISQMDTDILLIDELPPQLKSRFYFGENDKNVPYLAFPWIRKEDPWRRK